MQVWSTNQVEGVHRFLARSYRLVTGENVTEVEPSKDQLRSLHIAIKRVRLQSWNHRTSLRRLEAPLEAALQMTSCPFSLEPTPLSIGLIREQVYPAMVVTADMQWCP